MAIARGLKRLFWALLILFIGLPLGLVLLGGLAYAGYGLWARGGVDDAHVAYLKQHRESAATPEALRFTGFDSAFYRNKLFLLGESHGCAVPQDLDFVLLRHLNQRVGVRRYVAEIDPAQAHCFNEYLRTGDEAHLHQVFDWWAGAAQWGNQDFYHKIQRIRELNQTLPAERRISFVGIDRIQQLALTTAYLELLLGSQPSSAPALDSLRTLLKNRQEGADDLGQLAPLARRAGAALPALPDSVAAPVQTLLRNVSYLDKPRIRRDSVMLLNLGAEYAAGRFRPDDKLYGLWGLGHVLQEEFSHTRTLASLVKRSALPCRDGVVSLPIMLLDSEMMLPAQGAPSFMRPTDGRQSIDVPISQSGPLVFVPGLRDLTVVTEPHTVSLFKLDAPGSPYRRSNRLTEARAPLFNQMLLPTKPGAVATDYFQYAFLVRNSPAVKVVAKNP